jgi:hypothetical protein
LIHSAIEKKGPGVMALTGRRFSIESLRSETNTSWKLKEAPTEAQGRS